MDLDTVLERALSFADDGDWASVAGFLRENLDAHADAPAIHCWLGVAEQARAALADLVR